LKKLSSGVMAEETKSHSEKLWAKLWLKHFRFALHSCLSKAEKGQGGGGAMGPLLHTYKHPCTLNCHALDL
jgi:hypothetical protein